MKNKKIQKKNIYIFENVYIYIYLQLYFIKNYHLKKIFLD